MKSTPKHVNKKVILLTVIFFIALSITSLIVFAAPISTLSLNKGTLNKRTLKTSSSFNGKVNPNLLDIKGKVSVIITFTKKPEGYRKFIEAMNGRIIYDYNIIEGLMVKINTQNIKKLQNMKNLIKIHKDEKVRALLHDSAPMISADNVWAQGITGKDIKVCIVDTGIDYTHSAFGGCFGPDCKVIDGYDFVNKDSDPIDDDGHGTHVAGIVSSDDPYYRGIANGTKIMIVKVLDENGEGYQSDVIAGIEWCVNHSADIMSMSLGRGMFSSTCDDEPESQAVNAAVDKNVTVVVSSGNAGGCGMSSPACASKVIAVGAVDKSGNVVGYSSKGSELDIVAPGHDITSTYLNNGWAVGSGTSMAAPHVAGVVALMLQKNCFLLPTNIRGILNETGDDVATCYESCELKPNVCLCWNNPYKELVTCERSITGAGIVNASRAVDAILWDYDVNDDHTIDTQDLSMVVEAYGNCGDSRYNQRVDFNNDCLVDIFDLAQVAINYGKSC